MTHSRTQGVSGTASRRQFLKRTLASGGALALPYIIPASVLGRDGAVAHLNVR